MFWILVALVLLSPVSALAQSGPFADRAFCLNSKVPEARQDILRQICLVMKAFVASNADPACKAAFDHLMREFIGRHATDDERRTKLLPILDDCER